MKTPTEVIASLSAAATGHGCISQRLEAIRDWLATSDGQAYVADLSEPPTQSLWSDDSFRTDEAPAQSMAG